MATAWISHSGYITIAGVDESHQAKAEHQRAEYHEKYLMAKQIERDFNAGNWDAVINTVEKGKYRGQSNSKTLHELYPLTTTCKYIALANRDDNYLEAFDYSGEYVDNSNISEFIWGGSKGVENTFEAGKKAWERVHGRTMTKTDLVQANIELIENELKNRFNGVEKFYLNNSWVTLTGREQFKRGMLDKYIKGWEKINGREMSKEDEIRICGEPFLKRNLFGKRKYRYCVITGGCVSTALNQIAE